MNNDLQSVKPPSFFRANLALVLGLLVVGCVSFSDGAFKQIEGQFFDDRHVNEIIDGKTSTQEAMEWFGSPTSSTVSGAGAEILRYYSVRARRSVVKRFFRSQSFRQTVIQELIVDISSGVVVSHHYNIQTIED